MPKRTNKARVVWEKEHGPIPDGWHVHHASCDPTDDSIENLLCVPGELHRSFHLIKNQLEFAVNSVGGGPTWGYADPCHTAHILNLATELHLCADAMREASEWCTESNRKSGMVPV